VVYFAVSDAEFQGLFRALRRPEWAEDPRFGTFAGRIAHREILEGMLREEFRTWPSAEILARLAAESLPGAPVHSLEDVIADPQVRHNGAWLERDHPAAGRVREAAPPARFASTPAEPGRAAPRLGEHTDEILAELGVGPEERRRLREEGVVG
jgi:crotonobetainyl-CoA:carnitine CoA-transferase CaiB-like acyl-CoA transferase